jgi:ankyrin repeat protein
VNGRRPRPSARPARRRRRSPRALGWLPALLWAACGDGGPASDPFPLQDAASQNVIQWIDSYVAAGHDPKLADDRGVTALHVTVSARIARKLIDLGAAVDAVADDGTTPLHAAVIFERPALVQLLIKEGAPVGAVDGVGWQPLHYAAASNDPRNLTMLLRAGADPQARTADGERAVDIARRFQNHRCVRALEP